MIYDNDYDYDNDYEECINEECYDDNDSWCDSDDNCSWCDSDYYEEQYSVEDSLMDALDGVPDAYWNID